MNALWIVFYQIIIKNLHIQGKNLFAFSILLKMETLDKFHIALFFVAINCSLLVSPTHCFFYNYEWRAGIGVNVTQRHCVFKPITWYAKSRTTKSIPGLYTPKRTPSKWCHCRTYQNHEEHPRTSKNSYYWSHFSVSKINWIFSIFLSRI